MLYSIQGHHRERVRFRQGAGRPLPRARRPRLQVLRLQPVEGRRQGTQLLLQVSFGILSVEAIVEIL